MWWAAWLVVEQWKTRITLTENLTKKQTVYPWPERILMDVTNPANKGMHHDSICIGVPCVLSIGLVWAFVLFSSPL